MNFVNQTNPYGSVQYNQTGSQSFTGADGKQYTLPSFTQTTSYTPEGQAILDSTMDAQQNMAQTAANQSAAVQDTLSQPFEFNNQDAANWAYDLGAQRLDPRLARQEEALRTRLINSGIRPGTEAYDREMNRNDMATNDAYNQLMLQGRGQAFNEGLTTRNQSLNELNALLSGSQLQNPGAVSPGAPQTSVAGVDYSGLVNQNYQAKLGAHNAMLGGLFGLAGAGVSAGLGPGGFAR